ncbi:hypothetical protein BASA81_004934 [Batrachochytrium salamandrivorans]|nr:hypothetical protein BASA81_004934 [Batrachochytrium salamandrivorans]
MQSDAALERFDKLRLKTVTEDHSVSTLLAEFQSTAASLEPDERIELEAAYPREGVELSKAVLADPQANKICSLVWWYDGKEDVNSIIPLLVNNCPELASLAVRLTRHSAFDFVSSMLEHPSNKIKVLEVPTDTKGDLARFFAALGQSQVSAITLSLGNSYEFYQRLCEYLAKDLLVRLKVTMSHMQVPPEMMMSLAKCTRLTVLVLSRCKFPQSVLITFPKFITKLKLSQCWFAAGMDWSFLADSSVRELDFSNMRGVDGNLLGRGLAVHLRAKGLDKLCLRDCGFTNLILDAIGIELGRIGRLDIGNLNDAFLAQIVLVLQSPNNEIKELVLGYTSLTMSSIENLLVPALKHSNCNLVKLSLWTYLSEDQTAAKTIEHKFRNRLALFALLQGQQVRRWYCPLRRLPVEMLRLAGQMLM